MQKNYQNKQDNIKLNEQLSGIRLEKSRNNEENKVVFRKNQLLPAVSTWNIFCEIAASMLFSGFFGHLIDSFFSTSPLITVICIVLGIVAGMFNLYKTYV